MPKPRNENRAARRTAAEVRKKNPKIPRRLKENLGMFLFLNFLTVCLRVVVPHSQAGPLFRPHIGHVGGLSLGEPNDGHTPHTDWYRRKHTWVASPGQRIGRRTVYRIKQVLLTLLATSQGSRHPPFPMGSRHPHDALRILHRLGKLRGLAPSAAGHPPRSGFASLSPLAALTGAARPAPEPRQSSPAQPHDDHSGVDSLWGSCRYECLC